MSDCEEQEQATAEALPEEPTRRAPRQRGRTQSIKRLSKRDLEAGRTQANADLEGLEFTRPKTRGECQICPTCQEWRDAQNGIVGGAGVRGVGSDDPALHQSKGQGVQELRRARDTSVPSVEGEFSLLSGGHGLSPIEFSLDRENEQQRSLLAGELRVGPSMPAKPQQTKHGESDNWREDTTHRGLGERNEHCAGNDSQETEERVERLSCGHDTSEAFYHSRPCAFVACRQHLYLDVNQRSGSIKHNFPHLEVWDLPESCALDVADRGSVTLEEVGVIMNLTRERIRQLETKGIAKIKALNEMAALMDYVD